MLKREVVKPRSLFLETIAILAALSALAYASGCDVDPVETQVDEALVDCCVMYPEGFGLEGCVKTAIDDLDAWSVLDMDPYGCVSYSCPDNLGPVRWTTRVCP